MMEYIIVWHDSTCSNAKCGNDIFLNINKVKLSYHGICKIYAHKNDTKTLIIMRSTWKGDDNI